ncbi:hypothetical protein, partial [Stenotrophomonas tumulicola]|uniref:hypothetical protein n=1 Tax=Stenotrophomonas tumulicola TaxID=1685415 RepID=UPI001C71559D
SAEPCSAALLSNDTVREANTVLEAGRASRSPSMARRYRVCGAHAMSPDYQRRSPIIGASVMWVR